MSGASLPAKRWWIILPLAFITYSLAYLDRANYGFAAAAGIDRDLGISHATSSLIGSLFFLGYFFFQIPGGIYAERRSVRKLIFVSLIAWGALAALTGVVSSIPTLMAVRFALGIVEAAVLPCMLVYVTNWFSRKERSRANTVFLLGNPATVLWMSVVSGYMTQEWGWRAMFIAQGLPAVVWAFVWLAAARDKPSQVSWLTADEKLRIETTLADEQKSLAPVRNYREAFRTVTVWKLAGTLFFHSLGFYGFLLWLPSILRHGATLSMVHTGWLSAVPYLGAVIFMLPCAWMSDRLQNRKLFVMAPLFVAAIAFFLLYFVGASNFYLSFSLLTVAGILMYVVFPPFFSIAPEVLPRTVAGGALALINSVGALGSFLGSYAVGYLTGLTGDPTSSYLFMGASLLVSVCLASSVKRAPQARSVPLAPAR
ncbi:MFS transporter [Paraburkholderia sabiae]|uniref:MFS transporter n=1 Tax=Paraburkholderia sabiae TaxID=273251 RepID=A0ABU9QHV4_9BURK|nr:MFS transporter [Paraburkholderia sabiae]WJZ77418.1 MFS transporter [Paraburkholderia sabiae]CAD6557743.1 Putative tartrate transporter [Paraburkholderia sabiae]